VNVGAHPSGRKAWIERGACFLPGSSFPHSSFAVPARKDRENRKKLPIYRPTHLNTATLPIPTSIGRLSLRRGFPVVALALTLTFPLSLTAQAVDPPPDGGYPNGNTADGTNALFSLTDGAENTAIGASALASNTTGNSNTGIGFHALVSNTTGVNNTATGVQALASSTAGSNNTASGYFALASSTGNNNTANGSQALRLNTADNNTAIGSQALQKNNFGGNNTAIGSQALFSNTVGTGNTATGAGALFHNGFLFDGQIAGNDNTANGAFALFSNVWGGGNTATGSAALQNNRTGSGNTATGAGALFHNTAAKNNTATGTNALANNTTGINNTASGFQALLNNTIGSLNIALGSSAGANLTTGSNNIDIGNAGVAGEASTIRIGKTGTQTATYIAGISGKTVANGVGVIVNSTGQLGTVTSSARFKTAIKPMDAASESILALNPVTFRYKQELDPDGVPQFGLIAEQVEKVNPNLVVRGEDGKPYTVRYEAVNAMLLNEFLKEHRRVEAQRNEFESKLAQQQKQIEALTAALQKVSAHVGLSSSFPQTVADNQ